ncbi:hypothetical protein AAU61_13040 [Desulfocarbo indianensis]|nr:hypothetical protein AAU61_13040 [Desulfocarbo indianensis]
MSNPKDGDASFPAKLESLRRRALELEARRAGRQTGADGLYQGDENYRSLVNNVKVGVYRNTGGPKGRFLRANPAIAEMFGYKDVASFLEAQVSDLYVRPEERESFIATVTREGVVKSDLLLRRQDGSQFLASCTAVANYGSDGSLIWIDGVIEDVSEQRRAEAALIQSEAEKSLILDSTSEMVIFQDADHRVLWANRAAAESAQFSPRELQGRYCYEIWNRRSETCPRCPVARARQTGRPQEGEMATLDGRFWYIRGYPVHDAEGRLSAVVEICQDITERKTAEIALRQSEEKYSKAFRQSPAWVCISTLEEGRYLEANDAFLRATGYTCQEVIGKTSAEMNLWVDPTDRRRVEEEVKRCGFVRNMEVKRRAKDGTILDMLFSCEEILLEGERCLISVSQDITEQNSILHALRFSEEKFAKAFRQSPVWFLIATLEDGRLLEVNDAFLRVTGFDLQEVIGKTTLELGLWVDTAVRRHVVGEIKRSGSVDKLEIEVRGKAGRTMTMLFSAEKIVIDGEECLLSVAADISDRKLTEKALKDSEEKYRSLIQNMQDVVFLVQDGRIKLVSDRVERIAGYSAQELLGRDFLEIMAPEERQAVVELHRKHMAGQEATREYETVFIGKDGSRILVLATVSVIDYEGRPAVVGTLKDITEYRKSEAEKAKLQAQLQHSQKMEAVGTLASGVAHDFNNILQGIRGYVQLMHMHADSPEIVRQRAADVDAAVERANDLVQRMLAFGRKLEPELKPVDLNHEVEQAALILERTIPKMIKIEMELAENLSPIYGDPNQLGLLILNLANNAADAMPQGGRLVMQTANVSLDKAYCQQHLGASPGDYVRLTISDTGQGMDRETQEKIFDPFFTTKAVGRGSGLGLSIVYGIAQGHDGHVSCYSEPGKGSTFRIHLPASTGEIAGQTSEVKDREAIPGGQETLLVVDDEEVIVEVVQETLGHFGYTVLSARSGEEALETYARRQEEISLVILDIGMPGMGGLRCLEELYKMNPGLKAIVASGYGLNGQLMTIYEMGAKAFLSKPYHTQELLTTLRQVLDD